MLHDNLLSHPINLSFPLRWQRLTLPLSSHSPNTRLWGPAAQDNADGIPRHSSLLWSTTPYHRLGEMSTVTCQSHVESWATGLLFPSGWFPDVSAHHAQLHWQAEVAIWGAFNRTAPPQSSLLLCWLMDHKIWLWVSFMSQPSRSNDVPSLRGTYGHSIHYITSYAFLPPSCSFPHAISG